MYGEDLVDLLIAFIDILYDKSKIPWNMII